MIRWKLMVNEDHFSTRFKSTVIDLVRKFIACNFSRRQL